LEFACLTVSKNSIFYCYSYKFKRSEDYQILIYTSDTYVHDFLLNDSRW